LQFRYIAIEGPIGAGKTALAERLGIARDRFEFQMLYGVRPRLQQQLAERGFKVLVATPFGPQWYPYLMRRLAERPARALNDRETTAERPFRGRSSGTMRTTV